MDGLNVKRVAAELKLLSAERSVLRGVNLGLASLGLVVVGGGHRVAHVRHHIVSLAPEGRGTYTEPLHHARSHAALLALRAVTENFSTILFGLDLVGIEGV